MCLLSFSECSSEFQLLGVSTEIATLATKNTGVNNTHLYVAFHVSRQTSFYFWKALLPLYMMTFLSFTTFQFEANDLGSRSETISGYFMASFGEWSFDMRARCNIRSAITSCAHTDTIYTTSLNMD
jgi:hypothetical protein